MSGPRLPASHEFAAGADRPAPSPPSHSGRATPGPARSVQPEMLDALPEDAPDARASRRDLRIINRLLGSTAWFRRVLRAHHRPGERILEIGAGTGELGRTLCAITPDCAGLDRIGRPRDWPQSAAWIETDVREFAGWGDYPIVIGNLFFHHFDREELAQLGARLNAHARVIIASDPLRARRTERLFSWLGPLMRANPVTRYDARVSIAAGFRGDELPRLWQLDPAVWGWRAQETWRGSSRIVAEKRA